MNIHTIKLLINTQAAIHKSGQENYELEACEVIVYNSILDFCIANHLSINEYKPADLVYNAQNYSDEKWRIIAQLYADILSEENKIKIHPSIIELLDYYHNKFWAS